MYRGNLSWGAAEIWAVDFFSTTDFDENIIFVLSKDHTFRIRCTLMNPAQFLILVTHLILYWLLKKKSSETKFERITSRNFFHPISHYAGVHGKNNAYHNDNKAENKVIYEWILNLIDIVTCVVFTFYSSMGKK